MIGVEEAQARILALASPLTPIELPLVAANRHYLANPVIALRDQPAADISAMDGYAIRHADMPGPWQMIGASQAGRPFSGEVQTDEAVRIFTGAHMPAGADAILIQEDAARDGDRLTLSGSGPRHAGEFVRKTAADFASSDILLETGMLLNPGALALAAMAGHGSLKVGGRPNIAIISSGDELVPAGSACTSAQIPSSNDPMLAAMLATLPCEATQIGIIPDDLPQLETALRSCAKYDIVVTSGGASVGDHDLVRQALINIGAEIDFWKVSMKPGKPLMAGRIGKQVVLGLPGNPSSAFVTAFLFLLPLVRHMAGCPAPLPAEGTAEISDAYPAGGNRTEYVRAHVAGGEIRPFSKQDSGLTNPIAHANALFIREIDAPALVAGDKVQYLALS